MVAPYLGSFPNFEVQLTPQQLPGDVDIALKGSLEGQKKFPEAQRLFSISGPGGPSSR
jgi:hypothetical protein